MNHREGHQAHHSSKQDPCTLKNPLSYLFLKNTNNFNEGNPLTHFVCVSPVLSCLERFPYWLLKSLLPQFKPVASCHILSEHREYFDLSICTPF